MSIPSRLMLALVVTATASPRLAAQRLVATPLDSGAVVRLHLYSGERVVARLIAPFGPDSAAIRYCPYQARPCGPEPDLLRVARPAADLERVERPVGSKASTGFAVGAGIALALGIASANLTSALCECRTDATRVALGVALSGAFWGTVAALIGANSPRWEAAP